MSFIAARWMASLCKRMNAPLLLGIDIGTTNCKAIIFEPDGRAVSAASAPTPVAHPRPGWAEHDPELLWQAVAGTIRRALAAVDPSSVVGVGITSVGEAGVLLDRLGMPLCPIIAWHDGRTVPQHRRWLAECDPVAANAITGMPSEPIYTAYKLLWLRDNDPEAYSTATRWLHVADYIAFRLCGAQACDYSLASRTMLLDLRTRQWSDTLVEAAGLRRELLPELLQAGTALGRVTPIASAETGLTTHTMVAHGGHDHICGAFAAGVSQTGMCLDSLGTAEAVFLPLEALPPEDILLRSGCSFGAHVARDSYYTLDGLWSGGGAIAWARALLLEHGLAAGAAAFDAIERLAAQAPPGSQGVLFLPRLAGGERGAFVGLTTGTGPAALARSVYEGLAFAWRQHLEQIESALGLRAGTIRLIGGGTHSALWVQTKADVLGRALDLLAIEESVALGAALFGGLAAGLFRSEADALANIHQEARSIAFDPERADFYDRRYRQAFLHLAPALAEVHAALTDEARGAGV